MIKYLDLRTRNYEDRKKRIDFFEVDINDWKKNPYSFLKAIIYIELSTILAFFFQYTFLTANHISLMYCISGVFAGLLLTTNLDSLMVTGLIIFFLKGTFDWTDGLVARIKNETSSVGHILDTWGSHIGTISLISSLGIYCYNNSNDNLYLFLTIIILFIKIIDFKLFAYHQLFYELLNNDINFEIKKNNKDKNLKKKDGFIIFFIKNFLDDRARTVDLICFLIFLEITFQYEIFSKIIFFLYLIKTIILFIGIFYFYYIKKRIEEKISD